MTKEQIFGLVGLTNQRKYAYESWCDVMERLGKSTDVEAITNLTTANGWIDALMARTAKQQEAKRKKQEKIRQEQAAKQQIFDLIEHAKGAGYSQQDVIDIVMNAIKEKHNARIQEQIERLQAQML